MLNTSQTENITRRIFRSLWCFKVRCSAR